MAEYLKYKLTTRNELEMYSPPVPSWIRVVVQDLDLHDKVLLTIKVADYSDYIIKAEPAYPYDG